MKAPRSHSLPGEPKPKPEPLPGLQDDELLFAWAMREVKPLAGIKERVVTKPVVHKPVLDDDAEAYAELQALVDGRIRFNLSDSDEFIEGRLQGLDPRVVQKLRRGKFAIQDYLDLHGMTRSEAKDVLLRFVERSASSGKRSILVVHGRGFNSKDQIPVLKESLAQWLVHGKLARWVLCFCSARACDGGTGALYVLLRGKPFAGAAMSVRAWDGP